MQEQLNANIIKYHLNIHSKFWNGVNRKCASLAVYKHINYYEIGGNGFKTFPPIQPLAQPYFIVN